ncbi:Metallo-dependent hydrolase [Gonapodya prolifera JEL478]|uniref:Metallo-dependent hydrolase n=1 Tax=Gonapodya prolifera (strain JEL478) TaxID=1344416 RepID=A0A138ZYS5_GONPJ|nr:Metallo-dependent hydrolase [Gonapodya prolifera JEL478]|eukprot:KXS09631.1 Metallo-dependent hydrolase [Gonapodya prolifera JEL478]
MGQPPPDADSPLWQKLFDVHSHIIDEPDDVILADATRALKVGKVAVMGTRVDDWERVQTIAREAPSKIVMAFGVHPWFTKKYDTTTPEEPESAQGLELLHNDLSTLQSCLTAHRSAILGEVGLDKVATDPLTNKRYSLQAQRDTFIQQLRIAGRFRRPVSAHCVRAGGLVVEILEQLTREAGLWKAPPPSGRIPTPSPPTPPSDTPTSFPPSFTFHSCTLSPDLTTSLLRSPLAPHLYFSFSSCVSARSPQFAQRVLAVPDDKILLESDVHSPVDVDGAMWDIATKVAEVKGWSVARCVEVTWENACRCFGIELS